MYICRERERERERERDRYRSVSWNFPLFSMGMTPCHDSVPSLQPPTYAP